MFSSIFGEHLERLQSVFERQHERNLKLKPSKCELFKERNSYLGYIVSEEGIQTDQTKIQVVKSWPIRLGCPLLPGLYLLLSKLHSRI